ncbi:MAG: TIGR03905 family TSCPD domain-containing protein [Clostridiales bacterium]|nr:TIGR03905 family TSCPD domain-containing protein [Clostridiales bacterium]
MLYTYKTQGTCSKKIEIELEDDRIRSVRFEGGCNGNLKGLGALAADMMVDEVIDRLSGIRCGFKQTSCPDQLARALRAYKAGAVEEGD